MHAIVDARRLAHSQKRPAIFGKFRQSEARKRQKRSSGKLIVQPLEAFDLDQGYLLGRKPPSLDAMIGDRSDESQCAPHGRDRSGKAERTPGQSREGAQHRTPAADAAWLLTNVKDDDQGRDHRADRPARVFQSTPIPLSPAFAKHKPIIARTLCLRYNDAFG